MTAVDLENVTRCIGYGFVRYADLRQHRIGDYVFSDEMLDLKDNTAIYLMYYTQTHTHTHTHTHTQIHYHSIRHEVYGACRRVILALLAALLALLRHGVTYVY
jgi:hypothetical protein